MKIFVHITLSLFNIEKANMKMVLLLLSLQLTLMIPLANIPDILSLYRTSDSISKNISDLVQRYYPFAKKQFCPQDTKIEMLQLSSPSASFNAIITCNIHARELITSEICLDLIHRFVGKDKELTKKFNFKVLYLTNRERDRVFQGNYCIRQNQNKVDLNRNFKTGWFGQGDGKPEDNPGPRPMSQTYSQCLEYLAKKDKPLVYLDLHSGQFSLIYYQTPQQLNSHTINDELQVLEMVKRKHCRTCRVLNFQTYSKHLGEGSVYLKDKFKVKYSNTFELYGGYNANVEQPQRCLTIFNPMTQKELMFYRERWTSGIIDYFNEIYRRQHKK